MGLKAFIKRQSRRVFGTDEFVLNLQEIKETLTGPFLADMSSQANTGRECVAYLEQQTEVIIQTYYINLLNYKPHLNEYFSDFIDNLLSISRYKKLKTNNLSNSCLNYFLLKQNELKAVCGKLDSASIDALYYSIFLWVCTDLFFDYPDNFMYDRGRHFADYNLVERYVKNPYLKGVERKPEDAFMGDDIKGCYLIPSDVVKEGMYVIDGGAYTGDSAMLFSDCVGETGRVFSFEPFKESFDELAALKLPRVTCVNMGLSDTTATLPFWVDDSNNSGNAVVADGTSFINVTSLDEYVEENNIPRVDFIKLDIEGSEMDALKGMQRTLARFKPDLAICIYHNRGYDSIDVPIYLYSLLGDSYDYAITHHTSTWFETVIHAVKPDYYIDEKMRKAAVIDRAYTYPVKAGSPEWFKLNAAGRYRHSNIPANIAGKMTTRALAETVITYPYIFDFYAFNTSKSAYSALTLKCNALKELMGRADASEAINEALDNIDKIGTPTGGYNEKKDAALEAEIVKKIMLNLLNTHEQNLSGYDTYLTPGSVNVISEQCPNGLTADFYTGLTYEDFDAAFDMLEYIQNYLIPIMYPSAVLVEAHTPVFNSHSYAWSTRPGTSWLNNPAPYLSKPGHNGNYTEHDPLVKLSRLLFYNRDFPESSQEYYAHAAVVTWVEGQNSLMYSKWGIMGVYEHSHNESPYAALSFKIYNGNK